MNKFQIALLLFSPLFAFLSCTSTATSEYQKIEDRELARGVRQDSLFLGVSLGMTNDDFYAHCWKLNKQGLIMEGSGNTSVHHEIKDFPYPARMEFYPDFEDGVVSAMRVTFSYEGWSPWNKHMFSDKLILEVLALMKEWYGGEFLEIQNSKPIGSNAWVKVDANRRISIYYVDDDKVKMDIVDLIAMKAAEAKRK